MFLRAPLSGVIAAALLGGAFSSSTLHVSAAEPKNDAPGDWVVKSFQIPPGTFRDTLTPALADPFDSELPPGARQYPPKIKPLPPASASDEVWAEHIREHSRVLRPAFEAQGLGLRDVALLYDPASATLCARGSKAEMEFFRLLVEELGRSTMDVVFQLHVMQADEARIRRIVDETRRLADHSNALEALLGSVRSGTALEKAILRVEVRSGQRVETSAGKVRSVPEETLKLDGAGRVLWEDEPRRAGTRLSVDPIIHPDGKLVNVKVEFESHFGAPVERATPAARTPTHGAVDAPVSDFRCARITADLPMLHGATRLIGVWNPDENKAPGSKPGVMQAAFLQMHLVPVVPAPNRWVEAKFRELADKAVPKRALPPPPPPSPGALTEEGSPYMRSFLVPPEFLSSEMVTVFGPSGVPGLPLGEVPGVRRGGIIREVLEANGVTFEEGCTIQFYAATSNLVVRNTTQNHERIERFLARVRDHFRPTTLAFTLEIVQGEGAVLRRCLAGTQAIADHVDAWKEIRQLAEKGEVTILRTMKVEGASEKRLKYEAGMEHAHFVGTAPTMRSDARNADADGKTFNNDPDQPATGEGGGHSVDLILDRRMCGLSFEADPLLGLDRQTVDVNLAMEYHYARPTQRAGSPDGNGEHVAVALPTTDFHCANVLTALSMVDRMTKLLGVWKPEGAPEYEGKDVMQAAFLRVDVVPVGKD